MNGAFDSRGNLLIADSNNGAIRKITPFGIVSDYKFVRNPISLVVDECENLIVLTGDDGGAITLIYFNETKQIQKRLAGGEYVATRFNGASNLVQGNDGSLYVPDTGNHVIKKISFY